MPTIRGSSIQASSANSYTVAFPPGTVAGDTAIIFAGHGWPAQNPSDWLVIDNRTGSNWNGAVFAKIVSSMDIAAGSVTVRFSGTFDGVIGVVTLAGSCKSLYALEQQNGSGSSAITLTSATQATPDQLLLYWGSNRANSVDSVNSGTMLQQISDGSAASGCLYSESGASGFISRTYNYSASGSGNYQAMLFVSQFVVTAPVLALGGTVLTQGMDGGF